MSVLLINSLITFFKGDTFMVHFINLIFNAIFNSSSIQFNPIFWDNLLLKLYESLAVVYPKKRIIEELIFHNSCCILFSPFFKNSVLSFKFIENLRGGFELLWFFLYLCIYFFYKLIETSKRFGYFVIILILLSL